MNVRERRDAGRRRHSLSGRAERALVVLIVVVGAALALAAGGRRWASVTVTDPGLPAVTSPVSGGDLAAPVFAASLATLAATALVLVVRGSARRLVGLVLLLAAGVAAYAATAALPTAASHARRWALRSGAAADALTTVRLTAWPWVAAAGAWVAFAAAVLVVTRAQRWPDSARRYERAGGAPEAAAPASLWDSLDRGEDPTV